MHHGNTTRQTVTSERFDKGTPPQRHRDAQRFTEKGREGDMRNATMEAQSRTENAEEGSGSRADKTVFLRSQLCALCAAVVAFSPDPNLT
jgi:hypothetical protein